MALRLKRPISNKTPVDFISKITTDVSGHLSITSLKLCQYKQVQAVEWLSVPPGGVQKNHTGSSLQMQGSRFHNQQACTKEGGRDVGVPELRPGFQGGVRDCRQPPYRQGQCWSWSKGRSIGSTSVDNPHKSFSQEGVNVTSDKRVHNDSMC